MGGFFSSVPEPNVIVPTKLEKTFALGDGSDGSSLQDAFEFKSDKIDNLYTWDKDSKQFKLAFQEHGVAYGETNASAQLAEVDLNELSGSSNFKTTFDPTPVEAWGINFVGVVQVKHDDGDERVIYVPGTRSYDPAGMSGDPHASERIGPSCSRTQAAITLAQIMAALYGAKEDQVEELQEKLRPLITRYHGREALFDWMLLQIQEAIYQNKDVTPYPEFIKTQIEAGKIELKENREHTSKYLETYDEDKPRPPVHFYKKVAAKDNVEEIFSEDELEMFLKVIATDQ